MGLTSGTENLNSFEGFPSGRLPTGHSHVWIKLLTIVTMTRSSHDQIYNNTQRLKAQLNQSNVMLCRSE